jgi:DNA-binding SARP family transcriptional activator/predicted ATPase
MPTLHIHLLGDFLLLFDDRPFTKVSVPRLQSLLAYLLLHRNAPQDRSHLAFLLWPDSTEGQAHTNLRKALHQLRQVLPDIDQFLQADKRSLWWQPVSTTSWVLDVLAFEQALAKAQEAESAKNTLVLRRGLEEALQFYRGELLPSCYDEWLLPERDRLHQLFLSAADRLIVLLEQDRDYDAAIMAAQQLLRHDPLHEATYAQLMRFYALRGDRATALRVYHTCAKLLERELGTVPGEATRTIYESLLHLDSSVTTKSGPLTSRGAAPPLLGRRAEWRQLQVLWRKAESGSAHLALLSGEAGIGKTRLSEEMEVWASRQGIATAKASCYAPLGQLAYTPVTAWLRSDALKAGLATLEPIRLTEIARLVPEVLSKHPLLPRPAPMTEGWQHRHFFEALALAVSNARQPLLMLLDDLQWCDNETLEWLHYLFRFQPELRLLLIGTMRVEEILPDHRLIGFLGALQRDDLMTEIKLGPLTMNETGTLAQHILGHQFEPDIIETLYAETEGNPLFVVEMLRAGTLAQPDSGLPPTVQSVLAMRLAQLSPLALAVAYVAAVIGREFSFEVLASASGEREDELVHGLDELWQRRIIREQGVAVTNSYDFSHDKLRELAYASLSPARRRLLHRRVAETYEVVYEHNHDIGSGQIAAHYERAGLAEKAIPYYRYAAETALQIYANNEAIATLQHAAVLLENSTSLKLLQTRMWEEAAAIYLALGDVFAMMGRQEQAREAYTHALNWITAQESSSIQIDTTPELISFQLRQANKRHIWHARTLRKSAITWNLASHNPLDTFHVNARQTFQLAERELAQVTDKAHPEWIDEWINLQLDQLLPLRGSEEEMTAIIEKTQSLVEKQGTAEQRGQFFQAVAARDAIRDHYTATEEAVAYCRESLKALQQTNNKSLIGFAHFVLGNRLLWIGHLDEAEDEMQAAVNIAERIGSIRLLVRCLAFLPFVYRRCGQVDRVREVVVRALSMPEAQNNALIDGHRSWLAWRDGKLGEAEAFGRASINEQEGRQGGNAFRWSGLWPLIGVALAQERIADTLKCTRLLLDPYQQPPPEQLRTLLAAALQAWESEQQDEARALLKQAVPLAEQMGYL